jgi:hypothetical protein
MNKYLLPIAALGIIMTSCSGSSTKSADSTVNDTLTHNQTDGTLIAKRYISADLKKFGLLGSVKSAQPIPDDLITTCLNETLDFNEQGKLTTKFLTYYDNRITTDADGYITGTSCEDADGTSWTVTFSKLNDNGWATEGKYETEGPKNKTVVNFTYTYDATDSIGNWTQRTLRGTRTIQPMDYETGDYTIPQPSTPVEKVQTREVIYYQDAE